MALSAPYYYQVIARRVFVEDTGIVTTYGISIEDRSGRRLNVVEDISMDVQAVTALCDRLRDDCLYALQLQDAIIDWLNDL